MRRAGVRIALGAGLLGAASPLYAQSDELSDLSRGLPVTIEDAEPSEYGEGEVEGVLRYERGRNGSDLFEVQPRFQIGLFRNFEASFSVPYRFGDADESDSGDVELGGQYQFLRESGVVPAAAVAAELRYPYGSGSDAEETTLRLIGSKSLGARAAGRLHLNLAWSHVYNAEAGERSDRYDVAIGYSRPISDNALLAAALLREQQREDGRTVNFLELGVRYRLGEKLILAAGAGAGFGGDSPDYRVLFGLSRSFTLFR